MTPRTDPKVKACVERMRSLGVEGPIAGTTLVGSALDPRGRVVTRKRADVFDQLLGTGYVRKPRVGTARVIVQGKPVPDLRSDRVHADELPAIEDAKRAKLKAYYAERYQRDRKNPERMAARKAWLDANREKVRAWKRAYDERTRERQRAQKAAHQRRKYRAERELMLARARDYYQRNREAILAKKKAERDAARAAKDIE